MTKQVEFLFDVGSPTAYLAYTQLPGIAASAGADIVWQPILLGGLFKAVGNQSPAFLAPKSAWMASDLPRFANRYGVPFQQNKYFPINTLALMRGTVAANEDGILEEYLAAVFPAMWVQSKKMDEFDVVGETLQSGGIDSERLFTRIGEQSIKDSYSLRRASLNTHLPYYTTMAGALALLKALKALKENDMTVTSLQEFGLEPGKIN
mgnify:CR=1 FL=1